MKKVIVTISFTFLFVLAYSQPCLPDGITFTTQAKIDSFQVNYPGCSEIEGYVTIYGYEINNLQGLNVINSINEDLTIFLTWSLADLHGLESLTSVGGDLTIGMGFLTPSNQYICQGNKELINLDGLNNLSSIGGLLNIECNPSLINLEGLENLNSVSQIFIGVTQTYKRDEGGNEALLSLTGLENVNPLALDSLHILGNQFLSDCAVQSICEYLDISGNKALILSNAVGCNSPEEVQDSCEANAVSIDDKYIKDNVILYPNPANQKLNISAEGLTIDDVAIYTLTGQQVFAIRPKKEAIDISTLQPGMYIVEVTVENRKIRKKLLVK